MLFLKLEKEYEPQLVTFLIYLNRLSEEKFGHVPVDLEIAKALRKI
jgi:hypothetical protein